MFNLEACTAVVVPLTPEERAERREAARVHREKVKQRDLDRKQKRANKRSQAY